MKWRHAGSIVLALALTVVAAAQELKSIAPGTASLAGRIVDDDSRLPLEAVIVTLSRDGAALHTLTDEQGRYVFEGVAAGEYQITAAKEGYVRTTLRRPSPTVRLSDGEAARSVDGALSRSGSISGRVTTAGRPVTDAVVMAMLMVGDGGWRISGAATVRTNAAGEYTLDGLAAGTYQINVRWFDAEVLAAGARQSQQSVFYPAAEKASDAQLVRLAAGERLGKIDINLVPQTRVRLSGHFVHGATRGRVRAQLLTENAVRAITVTEDGAFAVSQLQPGRYTISARAQSEDVTEAASLTLDLQADMTDLVVPLVATGSISGRVVASDGQSLPFESLQVAAVIADRGEAVDPVPGDRVLLGRDGTFALRGLFGERVLRVIGLDPTWTIDRVLHGKTPVQSLTIPPGDALSDITVVLRQQP